MVSAVSSERSIKRESTYAYPLGFDLQRTFIISIFWHSIVFIWFFFSIDLLFLYFFFYAHSHLWINQSEIDPSAANIRRWANATASVAHVARPGHHCPRATDGKLLERSFLFRSSSVVGLIVSLRFSRFTRSMSCLRVITFWLTRWIRDSKKLLTRAQRYCLSSLSRAARSSCSSSTSLCCVSCLLSVRYAIHWQSRTSTSLTETYKVGTLPFRS